MIFPAYHLYVEAIAKRNLMWLCLLAFVICGFEILWLVRTYRPAWLGKAAWILAGGFYAALVYLAFAVFTDNTPQ